MGWKRPQRTRVRSILAMSLMLVGMAGAAAKSNSAPIEAEMSYLFHVLKTSACEFHRNGSWYDAKRAESHLRRKYRHYRDRDNDPSADEFITWGASKSSMSGKPYLVRCPGTPVHESGEWFRSALSAYRSGAGKSVD